MKDVPAVNRKLTDEQAAEIRYRVGMGQISQRKAAREYEVSKRTIAGIMAGYLYQPPRKSAPAFELVSVRPIVRSEVESGRAYSLFPLKRGAA